MFDNLRQCVGSTVMSDSRHEAQLLQQGDLRFLAFRRVPMTFGGVGFASLPA